MGMKLPEPDIPHESCLVQNAGSAMRMRTELELLNVIPSQGAPAYGESSPRRHVGQAVRGYTHLSRGASLADKTARNPWLPLASTTKEADSDFWGPNITKTKGPTAGTFSRDQRGSLATAPLGPRWPPARFLSSVIQDGTHTHTALCQSKTATKRGVC